MSERWQTEGPLCVDSAKLKVFQRMLLKPQGNIVFVFSRPNMPDTAAANDLFLFPF